MLDESIILLSAFSKVAFPFIANRHRNATKIVQKKVNSGVTVVGLDVKTITSELVPKVWCGVLWCGGVRVRACVCVGVRWGSVPLRAGAEGVLCVF